MEKQTIGQFLSALRRSNGYTQQEVAEKLGVSNKTVSCWERDSSYPDISAIPAIAELYGVTCDEILRAKRNPVPAAGDDENPTTKAKDNAEKAAKEASAIFDNMVARCENTQKIAVATSLFVTLFAVLAGILTYATTNYIASMFFTIVPVACIALFVLSMIQYRVDFAVPDDSRTEAVRKRMKNRKKAASIAIFLVLSYFLPYCCNFRNDSIYVAYGLIIAGFAILLLIAVNPVVRLARASYGNAGREVVKKEAVARIAGLCIAVIALVSFTVAIKQIPLKEPYGGSGRLSVDTIDELETVLTHRSLPETYELNKSVFPSVTDQYAKYSYTVARKDFDEEDLKNYIAYNVSGGLLDEYYSVEVIYPVWHVEYDEENPLTGESETKYRTITVYNARYQIAFLQKTDSYQLNYYDYNSFVVSRNYRNETYSLKFAAALEAILLLSFIVSSYVIVKTETRLKDKNKSADDAAEIGSSYTDKTSAQSDQTTSGDHGEQG